MNTALMDEQYALDVISGRRQGLIAAALRAGCTIASCGYGAAVAARNWAFDRGWLESVAVDVPVISIGNITAGGTGKTPLAAFFAERLQTQGYRPAIVSRGYRQLNESQNDEQLVLRQLLPDVPQILDRDRATGAQRAIRDSGCDVILLDDGFQHRRLRRQLDVVLIDATRPWGFGHLLPRGLLREPLAGLRRADLVVLTRTDQAAAADLDSIRGTVAQYRGTTECVETRFTPRGLRNAAGERLPLTHLRGTAVFAFCGIGNPLGFQGTLQQIGISAQPLVFPDHHHYRAQDLTTIAATAEATGASLLVTTHKDLVKLPHREIHGRPLWAIDIAVEIVAGQTLFDQAWNTLRLPRPVAA